MILTNPQLEKPFLIKQRKKILIVLKILVGKVIEQKSKKTIMIKNCLILLEVLKKTY